jgi:hypothetical protein
LKRFLTLLAVMANLAFLAAPAPASAAPVISTDPGPPFYCPKCPPSPAFGGGAGVLVCKVFVGGTGAIAVPPNGNVQEHCSVL